MPLPKGYTIDAPAAAAVTPPAGYTLDQPAAADDPNASHGASGWWGGHPIAPAAATPEPGFLETLGKSIKGIGTGIKANTWDQAVALHHIGSAAEAESPGSYGWAVLKAMGKGVANGSATEEDKAANDINNHEYLKAAGHHLAASLPIVGPAASDIADTATDPDNPRLDIATGKVIGLAAPEIATGALGLARKIAAPAPGVSAGALETSRIGPQKIVFNKYRDQQFEAAKAEYAKASGDLDKSHAGDVASAEQAARQRYGSNLVDRADKIDAAHAGFQSLHDQLIADARAEAASISPAGEPAEIGQTVGSSVLSKKAIAQNLYEEVRKATAGTKTTKTVQVQSPSTVLDASGNPTTITRSVEQPVTEGGVQVDLRGQKAIAQRYLDGLDERPYKTPGLDGIRAQLQSIVDGPDSTSFAGASGTASDLLDAGRKLDEPLPKLRGKINGEIAGELKRSTNAAVANADPAIGKSLDTANQIWSDIHKPIVQDVLDRVQSGRPETVHKVLTAPSTSIQDIRDLKAVISPVSFKAMSARSLSDAIENSIKSKTIVNPAVKNAPVRLVDTLGDSLTNTIEDLDRSGKLAELYPQTADSLRELVRISKKNKTIPSSQIPGKPSMDSVSIPKPDKEAILGPPPEVFRPEPSLGGYLTDIVTAGLGAYSTYGLALRHSPTGAAITGTVGLVTYGLAKLMTQPAGINRVIAYVQAASSGNLARAATLGTQLALLVNKQAGNDPAAAASKAGAAPPPPPSIDAPSGPPPLSDKDAFMQQMNAADPSDADAAAIQKRLRQ